MKVFKFGGASVKDSNSIRNIPNILDLYAESQVLIIVSAMGKTTNALVDITNKCGKGESTDIEIKKLEDFHIKIVSELFDDSREKIDYFKNEFISLRSKIANLPKGDINYLSDQIVSHGELLSSKILSKFLEFKGYFNIWIDARKIVRTDSSFTEGRVDWKKSGIQFEQELGFHLKDKSKKYFVSQGFLGANENNETVTLGREGSDFSGAIFAYFLKAESLSIWKDVPGMLNADPKWFDNTIKLDRISYKEALELAYYGASVIHPKTIKPLQNKQIPLYVKSFIEPKNEGTLIQRKTDQDTKIPSFIFKMDQVLISISPRDFSFIVEENLGHIFGCFAKQNVKINLMQNSALNFSVCVNDTSKLFGIIGELKERYKVLYNKSLELVTIRHYDSETIKRVTLNKEILVEQKSRDTARMVMRNKGGDLNGSL